MLETSPVSSVIAEPERLKWEDPEQETWATDSARDNSLVGGLLITYKLITYKLITYKLITDKLITDKLITDKLIT